MPPALELVAGALFAELAHLHLHPGKITVLLVELNELVSLHIHTSNMIAATLRFLTSLYISMASLLASDSPESGWKYRRILSAIDARKH